MLVRKEACQRFCMERIFSLLKKAWVGQAHRGEVWTDVVLHASPHQKNSAHSARRERLCSRLQVPSPVASSSVAWSPPAMSLWSKRSSHCAPCARRDPVAREWTCAPRGGDGAHEGRTLLHILKSKLLVAYRLLLDPIHDALAYTRSWAHTLAPAHAQLSAHARARTRVAARTRNHAVCCRFTKRVGVGWAVIRCGSDLTPRG